MLTLMDILKDNSTTFEQSVEEQARKIEEEVGVLIEQLFLPQDFEFFVVVAIDGEGGKYYLSLSTKSNYNWMIDGKKEMNMEDTVFYSVTMCVAEKFDSAANQRLFDETVLAKVETLLEQQGGKKVNVSADYEAGSSIAISFKVEGEDEDVIADKHNRSQLKSVIPGG